jgi:uncharacterized protein YecT (DUF1311 family)
VCFAPLPTAAIDNCENMSNFERGHCLQDYGNFLEKQMVQAYGNLKVSLERMSHFPSDPAAQLLNALQPSQQSFESFRKDHCAFNSLRGMGGNGTGLIELSCRNGLTQERTKYFRTISEHLGG